MARAALFALLGGILVAACTITTSLDGLTGAYVVGADGGTSDGGGSDAGARDVVASDGSGDAGSCGTFANAGVSSLQDDFARTTFGPAWDPIASCVTMANGDMTAAPPSGAQLYCHAWTTGFYHLTCDSLTVKVAETTAATNGVQTYVYILARNGVDELQFLLEGGGFALGDNHGTTLAQGGVDATTDVWWRFSERGGEMTIASSADGNAWRERGRFKPSFVLDDVQIGLGAGTYLSVTNPGRARFRCYNAPAGCN